MGIEKIDHTTFSTKDIKLKADRTFKCPDGEGYFVILSVSIKGRPVRFIGKPVRIIKVSEKGKYVFWFHGERYFTLTDCYKEIKDMIKDGHINTQP